MSGTQLTVVVVTYRSASVLSDCLQSLPAGLQGAGPYRVIVVDNASGDDTVEVAGTFDAASLGASRYDVLQTGRNGGYAAAINHAVEQAADHDGIGDVLVLNPDTRIRPGAGERLLLALHRSRAGIAVPRIVDPAGRLSYSLRRDPSARRQFGESVLGGTRAGRWSSWGEMVTDPDRYTEAGWTDWATGAVLLIAAECRARVGRWDESFFLYSEETDYCQRARRAGFGIRYVPDAVVEHVGGELETSPALREHLIRNKLALFRRQHGAIGSAMYQTAVAVNEASRAATGSQTHRAGLRTALRRVRRSGPPPVVLFSAQDYWYHNRAHSDVQLARGIASNRPVLLVNSIGMRMPTAGNTSKPLRRIIRKLRSTMRTVRAPESEYPDLKVMTPLILPFYGSPRLRAVNAWLVRTQVRLVCRALGFRRPHIVVTIPTAWDVVRPMSRSALVVNRSDRYSAFPEADQQLMRSFETSLLGACDIAVFVSHTLMDAEAELVGGRPHFLGHGVDYNRFATATAADAPADLAGLPHPRIGFFGGLDDYIVDMELIGRLADEIPSAQVVLIGDATCPMDELQRRPNLHWLGYRPYEQIPAYGAGFDVATMPWLRNEWSLHCNPIKAKEYLALGMPVVSTYYPEGENLRSVIALAEDQDEFIAMVKAALAGRGVSDTATRREFVRNESWQARAAELLNLADGVVR